MPQVEKKYLPQTQDNIRWLYQKYSATLLGYLAGVIADQQESEKCLVAIISRFAVDRDEDILTGQVTWLKLLQYSRSMLPQLQHHLNGASVGKLGVQWSSGIGQEKLSVLNAREREIFCGIYYHGRSASDLATSLGEREEAIRSQFKLSFDKIRREGGN